MLAPLLSGEAENREAIMNRKVFNDGSMALDRALRANRLVEEAERLLNRIATSGYPANNPGNQILAVRALDLIGEAAEAFRAAAEAPECAAMRPWLAMKLREQRELARELRTLLGQAQDFATIA